MSHASADGKFTVGYFLYRGTICCVVGLAIIGICVTSKFMLGKWAVFVYGLSLVSVILVMFLPLIVKFEEIQDSIKKSGGESDLATVLVGSFFSAVLFGLMCQEMQKEWRAEFDVPPGLSPPCQKVEQFQAAYLPADFKLLENAAANCKWIGFGIDNLLEDPTFDILSTYGLTFSNIDPGSFLMKFILISYRLLIDLVILQGLVIIASVVLDNRREKKNMKKSESNNEDIPYMESKNA